MIQKLNRGDVYFYDFGVEFDGSIEGKCRPAVIISNDKGNLHGTTVIVAPITTRSKDTCKPWQVHFSNDDKSQIVLLEQLRVVNSKKLMRYMGKLDPVTMKKIDVALAIELDLNTCENELQSVDFLSRLDNTLTKVITRRLALYDERIKEIVENVVTSLTNYKESYEKDCNALIDRMRNIVSEHNDINVTVNEIKDIYNKNSENVDRILTSLITIYKELNLRDIKMDEPEHTLKNDKDVNEEQVTKSEDIVIKKSKGPKSKYTVEFAIQFITDFYNMNRQEFMAKYDLKNQVMVNNRVSTLKNVLKKHKIDYKNIKHNITVYNINDLSEEEKQTKFSNYLKDSSSIDDKKTETKLAEPKTYVNANKEFVGVRGTNKGIKYKSRVEKFDYSVDNCLAFVKEWNETLFVDMCSKYNMTKKQMSARKYLICKWLLERNVEFKIANKRKESY